MPRTSRIDAEGLSTQVLDLVASGCSYREVAEHLGIGLGSIGRWMAKRLHRDPPRPLPLPSIPRSSETQSPSLESPSPAESPREKLGLVIDLLTVMLADENFPVGVRIKAGQVAGELCGLAEEIQRGK